MEGKENGDGMGEGAHEEGSSLNHLSVGPSAIRISYWPWKCTESGCQAQACSILT